MKVEFPDSIAGNLDPPLVLPLAMVVDQDFGLLSHASHLLREVRHRVIAHFSPSGLWDIVHTLRPDLLLLGVSFWKVGWAPFFRAASPETLIFPVGESPDVRGVLGLGQVYALLNLTPTRGAYAA